MNDVVEKIKEKLTQIEKTHNVHILYACESGSRAWGFASADSDYDVRFVFIRPLEEYLKINEQADYIDSELNEIFDINGWDLKKFFKNIYKSNPVLFEWINSPIVYRTSSEWEKIKSVVFDYAQEKALIFH